MAPVCSACGTTRSGDFAPWALNRFAKNTKGSYCRGCDVEVYGFDSSGRRIRQKRGKFTNDLKRESRLYNDNTKGGAA
jgi:hypothetical protein